MSARSTLGRCALAFLLPLVAMQFVSAQGARQNVPPIDDRGLARALCPIVYPVDDSPSSRGYHYLFYGNAFFINEDGYLLTAAHVLSQLHGGQPFLLIRSAAAPPHFVQAAVVAIDRDHDVALLRATPNPFDSDAAVTALPIDAERARANEKVLLAAERPFKPREAYTLEPSLEERSSGVVLGFEFSQLDKGRAETELLLFDHGVRPGQSGGPVLSLDSREVIGIVEGQWLRDDPLGFAAPAGHAPAATVQNAAIAPGAVIPIHYALALLQQKGIEWGSNDVSESAGQTPAESDQTGMPEPRSLVAAPFPSQSLFGGEVMLDAAVGCNGTLTDWKVVHGDPPFLQNVLDAIRTWTFRPGCRSGDSGKRRVAIAFQFPQPYIPPRTPTVHHYEDDSGSGDTSARLTATVEPTYPRGSDAQGSVIVEEIIGRDGSVRSTRVLQDLDPLTEVVREAVGKCQFAPGRQSGTVVDSEAILVVTFRHPAETPKQ